MKINAEGVHFKTLGEQIRRCADKNIEIDNVLGQRFIASGLSGKTITIHGTPGNALAAYLDGCNILVKGNCQEAAGDTMNSGTLVIDGSCGDACGYAMRGGKIFVRENAGYRAGIHMKQYESKCPALVIGGCAGSFLGEYQAGGLIVVLNLSNVPRPVGYFCGTGMHGGKIYIRCQTPPENLPAQVACRPCGEDGLAEIAPFVREFCTWFCADENQILSSHFYVLTPNTQNPYQKLYTPN